MTTSSTGGSTEPTSRSSGVAFASCKRAHGEAEFPDPLPGGGYAHTALSALDPGSTQFRAAIKACSSLAIASGFEHTPAEVKAHIKVLLALAVCMRAHGVPNFPDPNNDGAIVAPVGSEWNLEAHPRSPRPPPRSVTTSIRVAAETPRITARRSSCSPRAREPSGASPLRPARLRADGAR